MANPEKPEEAPDEGGPSSSPPDSSTGGGQGSLGALYKMQESPRKPAFVRQAAPAFFTSACILQILAALVGPWSVLVVPSGVAFVLFCNPFLVVLSPVVITVAALALYRQSKDIAYASGALGLLMFGPFFVGTGLSLLSLLMVRLSAQGKLS